MRFQSACLSSIIVLSLFIGSHSEAMEDAKEAEGNLISHAPRIPSAVIRSHVAEENKQFNTHELHGFQPDYKTSITDQEWDEVKQSLTAAADVVKHPDPNKCKASFWLKTYLDASEKILQDVQIHV